MALELLAGPFSVVAGDGTTPIDITEARFYPTSLYDDPTGLMSTMGDPDAQWQICVTQMDGVTYRRAAALHQHHFVLDLQRPGGWLLIDGGELSTIYAFDPSTGATGDSLLSGGIADMEDVQVRAADRWLTCSNAVVGNRALAATTGSFTTEYTLVGAGSGRANLSRTRRDGILCLAWPSGEVLFYDCIARAQVAGSAFLGANYGAWYSALHDVFVVLTGTSTNEVAVYANAVLPTAISDPVVSPALTLGRMSTVSVTLTGADGEPVAGELVDWTLAGPGALLATQSESDETGVASVGYIAPMTLSTDPTFTATVTL